MRDYYIILGIATERWRATYVTAIPGGAFWSVFWGVILELIFNKALSEGVLVISLFIRPRSLCGFIAWMASSGLPSRTGLFSRVLD
jgi:hypothetical protein